MSSDRSPSCPALCRASTSLLQQRKKRHVDGRDKPGHDKRSCLRLPAYRAGGSIVTMQSAPLWPDTTICPSGAPSAIGAVVAPPGTRTMTLIVSCWCRRTDRLRREFGDIASAIAPHDAARRGATGGGHRARVTARTARTAAAGLVARGANAGGITRDLADDPLGARLDDDDVVIGREVLVIAVLGFDRDDFRRQPMEPHPRRNGFADPDSDVEVALRRRQTFARQGLGNPHLLFGRDVGLLIACVWRVWLCVVWLWVVMPPGAVCALFVGGVRVLSVAVDGRFASLL